MLSPLALCESLAILCSGLFAGAALYISFVEHPARMLCGTSLAVTQFAPSYQRATVMQASLAALGTLAAIAARLMGAPAPWLAGGLLLGAVIPFTLIVILPTNKRLLDPSLDKDSKLAEHLLKRWATLHAVRTCLSLASFLTFLYTAIRR
jgi:anthrone oxygenase-like protein